jgi:hypothetical protein
MPVITPVLPGCCRFFFIHVNGEIIIFTATGQALLGMNAKQGTAFFTGPFNYFLFKKPLNSLGFYGLKILKNAQSIPIDITGIHLFQISAGIFPAGETKMGFCLR